MHTDWDWGQRKGETSFTPPVETGRGTAHTSSLYNRHERAEEIRADIMEG